MGRKIFMISIVSLIAILLAFPASGYAHGHWGHRGYWGGWYGVGAFTGGFIIGSALVGPRYYYPAPVYAYPPSSVVYVTPPPVYVPNQVYAYPDPAVTPGTDDRTKAGRWVEVPGQSINGTWVPPHRVWVKNNP